jgi:alkylation response protein AidB-like acyl-CoA dehydrogenase
MMFCLVRTSQEDIRQLGISFLLIDMSSPGISVNPIITLDTPAEGFQEINMVYFEDVKVPKENLVGEEGKGWTCAKYLLEFERGNAYSPGLKHSLAHVKAMAAGEAGAGGIEVGDLEARIRDVEIQILAMEFTELRILGALAAGQNLGPESSMLKTRGTELQQAVTELALEVVGHYALPLDQSLPVEGDNLDSTQHHEQAGARAVSTPGEGSDHSAVISAYSTRLFSSAILFHSPALATAEGKS